MAELQFFKTVHAEALLSPLRLALTTSIFRIVLAMVPPSAIVRLYIERAVGLGFFLAVAWAGAVVTDIVAERWRNRLDPRVRVMTYSVLPLGRQIFKMFLYTDRTACFVERMGLQHDDTFGRAGSRRVGCRFGRSEDHRKPFWRDFGDWRPPRVGSVVASWIAPPSGQNPGPGTLFIATAPKDAALGFAAGQWVELSDDTLELNFTPGTLCPTGERPGTGTHGWFQSW
jgi:hypothetical protein